MSTARVTASIFSLTFGIKFQETDRKRKRDGRKRKKAAVVACRIAESVLCLTNVRAWGWGRGPNL